MSESAVAVLPVLPFIHLDQSGRASLRGSKCKACGIVLLGVRRVCAACGGRDALLPIELSTHGTLYAYAIVHRSFPGVRTPFIAATVDLEGGGTLKGTLLDVAPDTRALPFDMPVEVVFRDSGQRDAAGRPFIAYYFIARGAS